MQWQADRTSARSRAPVWRTRRLRGLAQAPEYRNAPSTSGKVLQGLQDKSVRKSVAEIADQDVCVESHIKHAVDDTFTGEKVLHASQVALDDALTQDTRSMP